LVGDTTEQQIVRYLGLTGPASPKELTTALGLARRTVARKLSRLRAAGLCEVSGRTKSAHYRIRTDCSRN
jgi:DNA-binding transcriptional ArsR family regulator